MPTPADEHPVPVPAIVIQGRIFGHIEGHPVGSWFKDRLELSKSRVHRENQAGITSGKNEGADSIVLSGGYEDDEDQGDVIIYTGHGGRDANGRQIKDQEWTKGNSGLAKSSNEGLPVRVIRGSTAEGYRYDGLYKVESFWRERGISGFLICRFKLFKINDYTTTVPPRLQSIPETSIPPARIPSVIQRIVRNTSISREVKELYAHHCQICSILLATPGGSYSEGAHIRPLGNPHNGSDSRDNILCLCPNHHVLFDKGAIYVRPDLSVIDSMTDIKISDLKRHARHHLESSNFEYHRSTIANVRPHENV